MNVLEEWWKRLLISFVLGKMTSEGLRLVTCRKVEISALLITLILYFVLTGIYNRSQYKLEKEKEKEIETAYNTRKAK